MHSWQSASTRILEQLVAIKGEVGATDAQLARAMASLLQGRTHLPSLASNPRVREALLRGVWLAFAYWRTRSLWFPLGVHWSWNWTMASVLGTPVSGITELAPQPLLRATETGADWFTGGTYGIEGGAACTIILLISTLFVWRTKLLSTTEEMGSRRQ